MLLYSCLLYTSQCSRNDRPKAGQCKRPVNRKSWSVSYTHLDVYKRQDIRLLAFLYSSQLITKDKKSLSDSKRFYFKWVTEILSEGLERGEFKNTSSAEELMNIYAMYERAMLYDWSLFKGKYSLSEYSDKLLPHVLDTFVEGV